MEKRCECSSFKECYREKCTCNCHQSSLCKKRINIKELKTLEDLDQTNLKNLDNKERWLGYKFVLSHVLKEEAINWIKNCEHRGKSIIACEEYGYRCIACERTMKMNNISEEDLK